MKSNRTLKILIGTIAGIIVLLILVSVIVKIVFTKEKLLSMLVPRIETALNREVEIDDVSVSIWGGLGVDVEGMKVQNNPGFIQQELFKFDRLSIRVKFWPLLRKRVELKKLILENPEINLEKTTQGISNFEDLIKSEEETIVIPATFDQLEINNGKIVYLDNQSKKTIVLYQYQQKAGLFLDEMGENAEITGTITIPEIELSLPDYKGKLPPLTLSLEHKLTFNMPQQFLEIEELKLRIAEISVDIKGKLEQLNTQPILNLTVESGKIPIRDIFASLPSEESSPLKKLSTSGDMTISASIRGEIKEESSPEIQGKVTIENARVDFTGVPKPFIMPYGEMSFNNRSANFFSSGAKLADAAMEIKLVLENFSDPNLTSEVKAKLNLVVLRELVSLPENVNLAGLADVNIKAYGKIKKPEKMILSGRVDLQKAEIATPALGVPIRNLNAGMVLKDGNIDISQMSLSLGKSSLNLQGKLYGAVTYVLSPKKEPPLLKFNLNSPFMDFDEILPVSEETTTVAGGGKSKTEKPDSIMLPMINASGQIFIQRGIFRGVEFNNFSSSVEITNGVLKLSNIVSNIYSGAVGGEVKTDLKQPEHVEFDMNLTANQIEANDFLSRFTAFDNRLFGKLNLNANFAGTGNSVEEIRKTLLANGTANFAEGKLANWEFLDSLSSFLGIKMAKEQPIRNLRNSFRIEDGRIYFDDFSAITTDGDLGLTGSLGLDGSLDYQLTVVLSPDLSARFNALGDLSSYLKNDQGRVVLDIKVGGKAKRPRFTFDTSRAEKRLQDQLKSKVQDKKEELKDEVKKTAEDLLQELLKKKKR
jgi:AsmA protein